MAEKLDDATADWPPDQTLATNPIYLTLKEGDAYLFSRLYVIEKIRKGCVEARLHVKEKSIFGAVRYLPTAQISRLQFRYLDPGILNKIATELSIKW